MSGSKTQPDERGKVVVIEDNRAIRELVTYVLEDAGYDVSSTRDGRDGLSLVSEARPDLVLLDLDLRGGPSGFQVLNWIRETPNIADTTVVALTAFAMSGDRDRVLGAGFNGYMAKPIDPQTFPDEIRAFLVAS